MIDGRLIFSGWQGDKFFIMDSKNKTLGKKEGFQKKCDFNDKNGALYIEEGEKTSAYSDRGKKRIFYEENGDVITEINEKHPEFYRVNDRWLIY